jgi:hypothetical protein
MTVTKVGWAACGDCDREFKWLKTATLSPFHSSSAFDFTGMYPDSVWNGYLHFGVALNPDLSITVSWTGSVRKSTDVDALLLEVFNVPQLETSGWSGLHVNYQNFWGTCNMAADWTVYNGLGTT